MVKVKERSAWMVMLTGVGVPGTRLAVRAASECRARQPGFGLRQPRARRTVKVLDKVDRLDTARTECGTNWRRSSRLPCRYNEPAHVQRAVVSELSGRIELLSDEEDRRVQRRPSGSGRRGKTHRTI